MSTLEHAHDAFDPKLSSLRKRALVRITAYERLKRSGVPPKPEWEEVYSKVQSDFWNYRNYGGSRVLDPIISEYKRLVRDDEEECHW